MKSKVERRGEQSITIIHYIFIYTYWVNEQNAIEIGSCEKKNAKYMCANAFALCVLEIPLICNCDLRQRAYYEVQ